jgi:hypothetical protein
MRSTPKSSSCGEKWKSKPSVLGLSNGVRELALVLPQADPGKAWQLQIIGGKEEFWQLGADIFQYAVDKQNMGQKGETHIVARDEKIKADKTIKVARIEYGGNWNPEPGGWRRLADWMHNKEKTNLEVVTAKLGKDKLDAKVVHLTGTTPLTLDAAAQVELRNVTNNGGTVVIDAAGGSAQFAESVERMLPLIFPGATLKPLPPEHPVFQIGATKLGAVAYRTYARKNAHEQHARSEGSGHREGRPRHLLLQPRRPDGWARWPTGRRHYRLRAALGDGDHVEDHPVRREMKIDCPRISRICTNQFRAASSFVKIREIRGPFLFCARALTGPALQTRDDYRQRSHPLRLDGDGRDARGSEARGGRGDGRLHRRRRHRGVVGRVSPHERRQAVIVLDDGPTAGGETARTTAHLTYYNDDGLSKIESLHGEEVLRVSTRATRPQSIASSRSRARRTSIVISNASARTCSSRLMASATTSSTRNSTPPSHRLERCALRRSRPD